MSKTLRTNHAMQRPLQTFSIFRNKRAKSKQITREEEANQRDGMMIVDDDPINGREIKLIMVLV